MKVLKGTLKKKNLEKLGKMSLAQKVQHDAKGAETAEEAATNLKRLKPHMIDVLKPHTSAS